MVVEFDTGSGRRPAENGFTRDGPDALFRALFNQNETVAGDAQQAVRLPDRAATTAEIVDRHLPANGARLDRVGEKLGLETLLFTAAERQDWKFRSAV